MAVLNSEHLFEQAERLLSHPVAGPPRQVDLRRAISAAYYGVFHFVLTAVADDFVGVTKKNTTRYVLVYRSVDHSRLRQICNEVKKQQLDPKYRKYAPANGFGDNIRALASAVLELQEKRNMADYDPSIRVKTSDANLASETARSAIRRYNRATETRQKAFMSLLVFTPR